MNTLNSPDIDDILLLCNDIQDLEEKYESESKEIITAISYKLISEGYSTSYILHMFENTEADDLIQFYCNIESDGLSLAESTEIQDQLNYILENTLAKGLGSILSRTFRAARSGSKAAQYTRGGPLKRAGAALEGSGKAIIRSKPPAAPKASLAPPKPPAAPKASLAPPKPPAAPKASLAPPKPSNASKALKLAGATAAGGALGYSMGRNQGSNSSAPSSPSAPSSSSPSSAPSSSSPSSAPSASSATSKPDSPSVTGKTSDSPDSSKLTKMQQWAKNFPKLAKKVRPGQSGYEEISKLNLESRVLDSLQIYHERTSALVEDIIDVTAYQFFSQGYTLDEYCDFIDYCYVEDIIEVYETFNSENLTESTVPVEFIEEQLQDLYEIVGALLKVGSAAIKGARAAGKQGKSKLGGALIGAGRKTSEIADQGISANSVVRKGLKNAVNKVKDIFRKRPKVTVNNTVPDYSKSNFRPKVTVNTTKPNYEKDDKPKAVEKKDEPKEPTPKPVAKGRTTAPAGFKAKISANRSKSEPTTGERKDEPQEVTPQPKAEKKTFGKTKPPTAAQQNKMNKIAAGIAARDARRKSKSKPPDDVPPEEDDVPPEELEDVLKSIR